MTRLYIIGGAILAALVIGSIAGWSTRDAFCDAARLRVENARLTAALRLSEQAAASASTLQTQLSAQKEATDELRQAYETATADKSCPAGPADIDGLTRILRGK